MTEDEEQAQRLLNSLNELCEEGDGDEEISARTIADRAGVDPERAVHLLFEMAAALLIEFSRSNDGDPDTSMARRRVNRET